MSISSKKWWKKSSKKKDFSPLSDHDREEVPTTPSDPDHAQHLEPLCETPWRVGRHLLDGLRILLLRAGDVERNPGHSTTGATADAASSPAPPLHRPGPLATLLPLALTLAITLAITLAHLSTLLPDETPVLTFARTLGTTVAAVSPALRNPLAATAILLIVPNTPRRILFAALFGTLLLLGVLATTGAAGGSLRPEGDYWSARHAPPPDTRRLSPPAIPVRRRPMKERTDRRKRHVTPKCGWEDTVKAHLQLLSLMWKTGRVFDLLAGRSPPADDREDSPLPLAHNRPRRAQRATPRPQPKYSPRPRGRPRQKQRATPRHATPRLVDDIPTVEDVTGAHTTAVQKNDDAEDVAGLTDASPALPPDTPLHEEAAVQNMPPLPTVPPRAPPQQQLWRCIFVRTVAGPTTFYTDGHHTVRDVKRWIEGLHGIPADDQRLTLTGALDLHDDAVLADCGLCDQSTLFLRGRLKGAGKRDAAVKKSLADALLLPEAARKAFLGKLLSSALLGVRPIATTEDDVNAIAERTVKCMADIDLGALLEDTKALVAHLARYEIALREEKLQLREARARLRGNPDARSPDPRPRSASRISRPPSPTDSIRLEFGSDSVSTASSTRTARSGFTSTQPSPRSKTRYSATLSGDVETCPPADHTAPQRARLMDNQDARSPDPRPRSASRIPRPPSPTDSVRLEFGADSVSTTSSARTAQSDIVSTQPSPRSTTRCSDTLSGDIAEAQKHRPTAVDTASLPPHVIAPSAAEPTSGAEPRAPQPAAEVQSPHHQRHVRADSDAEADEPPQVHGDGRVESFKCPIPNCLKIISTTNPKHLTSHLQQGCHIDDAFFDDPAMPLKRCPSCQIVWLQRNPGSSTKCQACRRDSAPSSRSGTPHRSVSRGSVQDPHHATPRRATSRHATPSRDQGMTFPHPSSAGVHLQPDGDTSPTPAPPPDAGSHQQAAAAPTADTPLLAFPSLDEVCLLDNLTITHAPKHLRKRAGKIFGKALAEAAHTNDEEHHVLALMFPKVIFGVDPSQKRGHLTMEVIAARLDRWEAGTQSILRMFYERRDAVAKHRPKTAAAKAGFNDTAVLERAEALVRAGQYSKALATLLAARQRPRNDETMKALKALHPKRHSPRPIKPPSGTGPGEIRPPTAMTVVEVMKAIRSFRNGTSPGALQLRIELIRELADADDSGTFMRHLTALLNRYQLGQAPDGVRRAFAGAALSALEKKDNGTRPIAAGESLRRIIGKVLCARVKVKANGYFSPRQLGVACPNGTERISHLARRFWHRNAADECLVKWDFRNAFNSAARARILDKVTTEFPELATWVWWTYGESTCLWYNGGYLESDEGVQQGDPLGPLLFSMAIQPIVDEIARECPGLSFHGWYLDDGQVGGSTKDVLKACEIVKRLAKEIGLDLNQGKCEVVFNRRPAYDAFPCDVFNEKGELVEKGYKRIYTDVDGGFCVLGTPIGSDKFVHEFIEKEVLAPCSTAFSKIRELEDPHVAYCLLRSTCSFSKLVHVLRTVPPSQAQRATNAFDRALRDCARDSLHLRMSDASWAQACLNVSNGGIGFRQTNVHRSAAYLASVSTCAQLDGWDAITCGHWHEAIGDFNTRVPDSSALNPAAPTPLKQHDLSSKVEAQIFLMLLAKIPATDVMRRAHMRSMATQDAGLWLDNAPCTTLGFAFTSGAFLQLIRWRLGMSVCEHNTTCPFCSTCVADELGYHLLTCRWGGNLGVRHNGIRDVFYGACQAAAWSPAKEMNIFTTGQQRAADVLVRTTSLRAFDFAVTHGCQPKYIRQTAEHGPGFAASDYSEHVKDKRYKARAAKEGVQFVAMVTDVAGNWTLSAHAVFAECSRDIAARRMCDPAVMLRLLRKRLSCAVMRGNVRALLLSRHSMEPDLSDPMPPDEDRFFEIDAMSDATADESNTCPAIHQAAAGTCLRGMVVTA